MVASDPVKEVLTVAEVSITTEADVGAGGTVVRNGFGTVLEVATWVVAGGCGVDVGAVVVALEVEIGTVRVVLDVGTGAGVVLEMEIGTVQVEVDVGTGAGAVLEIEAGIHLDVETLLVVVVEERMGLVLDVDSFEVVSSECRGKSGGFAERLL